jgi:hypothetical protein
MRNCVIGVTLYVLSLSNLPAQVSYQRLLRADEEPGNW